MKRYIYLLVFLVFGLESRAQTVSGSLMGHDYVDLGLPSGKKWATKNIEASGPTEFGDYFAWGETKTKEEYNWDNYRFCKNKKQDETDFHPLDFTKYVISKKIGKVDRRTVLRTRNDVATAKWGKKWRMPTRDEMHELLEGCVWTFTEDFEGMDIAGYVGTSKQNGNTIFFPSINSLVAIWSSSLYEPACGVESCCFNFSEDGVEMSHSERSHGQNVRAVVK